MPVNPTALILRCDRLGDLVLTTPLFRTLAGSGYVLDVICRNSFREILIGNPHVRAVFPLEEIWPDFPLGWWRFSRWLRSRRYDLTIVTPAVSQRLLLASLLGFAKQRIAIFGGEFARLTFHRVVPAEILNSELHYSEQMLYCATQLNLPVNGIVPEIFLSKQEIDYAAREIDARFKRSPVVIVHPGGGHVGTDLPQNSCNLPPLEYQRFCEAVLRRTCWNLVLTGTIDERRMISEWDRSVLDHPRVWNSVGTLNLRQFAAIIAGADLIVCGGTSALHIASALRRNTLSPMCPGPGISARCWGNRGGKGIIIERPRETCPRMKDPAALCGDFDGELDGQALFEEALAMLG